MANAAVLRRKYQTPGVVDGSLAYDFDTLERKLENIPAMDPDMYTAPLEETPADIIAKAREQAKAQVRPAERVSPVAIVGFAALAVLLTMTILCYVELTMLSQSVVGLKRQVGQLETQQVALKAEYEQAFDLAGVKEAALAAGMAQPSDSQTYYIDLSAPDSAEVYSAAVQDGAEGFLPALGDAVQAAVEYFR